MTVCGLSLHRTARWLGPQSDEGASCKVEVGISTPEPQDQLKLEENEFVIICCVVSISHLIEKKIYLLTIKLK